MISIVTGVRLCVFENILGCEDQDEDLPVVWG